MNIYKIHTNILYLSVMAIVFNATFNNITVISWRLFYLFNFLDNFTHFFTLKMKSIDF